VGAHYYSWFGHDNTDWDHWAEGHPNTPLLGEYSSRDPQVIAQQVDWAVGSGVDFFAMSWWGPDNWATKSLEEYVLKSPALDRMRYCIFVEAWGPNGGRFEVTNSRIDLSDPDNRERLFRDFYYMTGKYFDDPRYLHINGRPVVILYFARLYTGDYAGALRELRQRMKNIGIDPYLIGDVVYWPDYNRPPDPERLRLFDAITAYSMWTSPLFQNKAPHLDFKLFIDDAMKVYTADKAAANNLGVAFIPDVMPGFDSTHSRIRSRRDPVLRRSPANFRYFIENAKKLIDPKLRMLFVTTWNEWNEGSYVEPSREEGLQYLDVIKVTLR
jgi:hypothetical protein